MKLAKCSNCGRITDDFRSYGSLFLADEFPSQMIYVCGSACMADIAEKIESGEWATPVLRKAAGGYAHAICKPRKGYDSQPSQEALVRELIADSPTAARD